jgi:hypothetical protein
MSALETWMRTVHDSAETSQIRNQPEEKPTAMWRPSGLAATDETCSKNI